MKTIDKNEVKKDLYKSKAMAKFSHYVSGSLYYKIEVLGSIFKFPISTVEKYQGDFDIEMLALSSDLGTTSFESEIKGSSLNRWISQAIDQEEFIKVG